MKNKRNQGRNWLLWREYYNSINKYLLLLDYFKFVRAVLLNCYCLFTLQNQKKVLAFLIISEKKKYRRYRCDNRVGQFSLNARSSQGKHISLISLFPRIAFRETAHVIWRITDFLYIYFRPSLHKLWGNNQDPLKSSC